MKIYVASSWRNEYQWRVVRALRKSGHEVYDFKHPTSGKSGFHWSEIDPNWQGWTTDLYRDALRSEYAKFGFNRDFNAMKWADACVLCLPCGGSAHLEAGWMKGAGKKVVAYIPHDRTIEPELMYGLLDGIATDFDEIAEYLAANGEEVHDYADTGKMDPIRVYSTKKDCERMWRLLNEIKGGNDGK